MLNQESLRYYYIPGKDVKPEDEPGKVYAQLVKAATESFAGTNLVEGGSLEELGEADIQAIYDFFTKARKINPEVFNDSTRKHFLTTEYIALFLADLFEENGIEVNRYLLRAGALLHDTGRTFSHRRGRNDQVGHLILKKAGLREEVDAVILPDEKVALYPHQTRKFDSREEILAYLESVDEVTPHIEMAIVTIADISAKYIDEGGPNERLRTWAETLVYTKVCQLKPNKETMWPGEYRRQQFVHEYISEQFYFYVNLATWVGETVGYPIEDLVSMIGESVAKDPVDVSKIP